MPFNNFWRTFFAIALTITIFATIVAVLCFIHRRETRRAQQAEAQAQAPAPARASATAPAPARNGIDLPVLSRNNDFRESDETLVTPARPLVPAFLRPPIPRAANPCPV
ncbi:hypothetical protein GJ744_007237 [Endocarpon pusillum]|uniref:Uncharacterized protein n=1 Tax=Endocarpon pusillum TaxID=364733 RepID=A0A8H7E6F1_9EURO|nr:hypothetical protein GJ744_007237 [Endocarpon pusillum]